MRPNMSLKLSYLIRYDNILVKLNLSKGTIADLARFSAQMGGNTIDYFVKRLDSLV